MANLISRIGDLFKPERVKPTQEQGVAGFAVYGGYVTEQYDDNHLFGWRRWKIAHDMLAQVSVIAASVRFMSNLIARPQWSWKPVDDSPAAREAAEFMQSVIDEMDVSWTRVVRRSVMYKFHGFMVQEWVAMRRPDGTIGLRSIEPRPQKTITKWDVDDAGQIRGVVQTDPQTGKELYLPRGKLLYLVDDSISDRPDGMGWFHHLYEPAEHLKSLLDLEKIGFERDLRGIPIGRAPFSEINKMVRDGKLTQQQGNAMIEDLRDFVSIQRKSNETGMVFDSMPYESVSETGKSITSVMKWGVDLLSGDPQSVEEMGAAIKRLQFEIAVIMGTENLMTGRDGEGSRALSEDKSRNLYLTANSMLHDIAEAVERDIRDPIWKLNGLPDELKPKASVEDVAFKDAAQIAAVLADMASAGAVLAPDDEAIDDLRTLLGISPSKPMDPAMLAAMQGKPPAGGEGEEEEDPDGGEDPKGGDGGARKLVEKFDPNQPRAPAGSGNGGQWTASGATGAAGDNNDTAPEGNGAQGDDAQQDRRVAEKDEARRAFDEQRRAFGGDGEAWAYARGSGTGGERFRGLEATYTPTDALQGLAGETGLGAPVMHELTPNAENAAIFEGTISGMKAASPYGAAVYVYPTSDYQDMRLFMSDDGKSGFAIKSDGDIVSAFSGGGGQVHSMLSLAVEQGGTKLDAFDTVLPELYSVNGFKEVGRDTWADEYAPDDWDFETFGKFNGGRPDVVYMEYDPSYSPFANRAEKYNPNQPRVPAGQGGGGRWTSGGAGTAETDPEAGEPTNEADRGKVKELGPGDKEKLVDSLKGKTVEDMVAMGEQNQNELRSIGRKLEGDLGLTFVDPGPKSATRVREKLVDEGYEGPHQITDYSRATFVVDSPEDAEAVVNSLARDNVVYDKGWKVLPNTNYLDRKLYIQHDNGGLSEVQLVPRGIAVYKGGPGMPRSCSVLSGMGHTLYEISRRSSVPRDVRERVTKLQAKLYSRAIQGSAFLSVAGGFIPPDMGG